MRTSGVIKMTALGGAAVLGYASVIERNWFALRQADVPVLPENSRPVRLLHISDMHLTPGRHRLLSFLRTLAVLEPDLVVNTGDSIAHPDAVGPLLEAMAPLLDRPGVFVYGSNDLYSPVPRNPARYLWGESDDHRRHVPDLPWAQLGAGLESAGWLNLNNRRGRLKLGDLDVEVAGVHDSHIRRDRYEQIAGPADRAADLRLAVMHSPEPSVMDRFVTDGFDLLLAGHTHGGQVCLPGIGTLVTNCGIDRTRAQGLHQHPVDADHARQAWLHVSAGLGTSPYAPFRFSCRPEATLLTLIPAIS